ncbi:MAG TPA: V-type ATP synthase subunit D [bacterium]|nr:V-type ATP synthase subunit D [bacterium]HDP97971.1 V-type ATP synthase subunit D [bacterium]
MAKVKYTKNELKNQKENLKRFTRYLPTLELKKKQLLVEIRAIQNKIEKIKSDIETKQNQVNRWVDVFAEAIDLSEFFKVVEIKQDVDNIAGIDIPVYQDVSFEDKDYSFYETPLWVDYGIDAVKEQIRLIAELKITERELNILEEELRITIQRIKLFEEVKIPEAKENIRVIQIFLGDQLTAEVVRGKIAKAKIEKKKEVSRA